MTAREHFTEILNGMENIVNNHPYHGFALLAIFVEVLGKCLSGNDWQHRNHSKTDFNKALTDYSSLQKYKVIPDLYHILRCGIAHALLVKPGVILVPDKNDLPNNIIGCRDFYNDICQAWEDLKSNKLTALKDLDKEVMQVQDDVTGSTINNIYINN